MSEGSDGSKSRLISHGDRGVPGVIPPDALLNAEIAILSAAHDP